MTDEDTEIGRLAETEQAKIIEQLLDELDEEFSEVTWCWLLQEGFVRCGDRNEAKKYVEEIVQDIAEIEAEVAAGLDAEIDAIAATLPPEDGDEML